MVDSFFFCNFASAKPKNNKGGQQTSGMSTCRTHGVMGNINLFLVTQNNEEIRTQG